MATECIFGIYRKKLIFFLFYTFYRLHAVSHHLKGGAENAKKKYFSNSNNFGLKF